MAAGANGAPGSGQQPTEDQTRAILEYLKQKGFARAEAALRADLDPSAASSSSTPGQGTVPLDEFAARNAPGAQKPGAAPPLPQAGQQPQSGQQGQQGQLTAQQQAQMRRRPDQSVAPGQLQADPPSWSKGYEGLRTFVENSLDIHRPELLPLLLPIFVHAYLDLVVLGYRDPADAFLAKFSSDHDASQLHLLRQLQSIRLPTHISESPDVTKWRQERYYVKLSERGWGLLLGWLQGGGLTGGAEGTEARGKDKVLAIINERLKISTLPGPPSKVATDYGLASEIEGRVPPKSYESLKLGPAPVDPKLQKEVERQLKGDGVDASTAHQSQSTGGSGTQGTTQETSGSTAPTSIDFATQSSSKDGASQPAGGAKQAFLIPPLAADMLPYPATYRKVDVLREVEKAREARKRIKLGPAPKTDGGARAGALGGQQAAEEDRRAGAAKPSVCLFSVHDAGDRLTCTSFSEDSTLLAAGFSESYIRLWNLKGEKMPGMRADFDSEKVTDMSSLKKLRLEDGPTTRKLIGHSGPVYSLSFDPVPGPSGPPRSLLSSSQDSTVRLWSLDTYENLVAYKGHREPVWDVKWGPRGIYFATASRDRTARLWMSERASAVRIFAGHLSDVNCVDFHSNSLYLATGSSDRTCRLWDVQRGQCVRVFIGHRSSVSCCAVSPDGRHLASAAEEGINLWDIGSGKLVKTMVGHVGLVNSLSWSKESTVLVSGGVDNTVRAWDVNALPASGAADVLGGGAGGSVVRRAAGAAGLLEGVGRKPEGLKALEVKTGLLGPKLGGTGGTDKIVRETNDLMCTMLTKRTPVYSVSFTERNLCLAAGPVIIS